MADSDDTTTLPALSRRALLGGATVLPIGAADARRRGANSDPVLDLFHEWRALHAELDAWQDDWQKKEGVMLRTVGMPRVLVPVPGKIEPVSACEPAEIDELLEDLPGTEELRPSSKRTVAAGRWRQVRSVSVRWRSVSTSLGIAGTPLPRPSGKRARAAWPVPPRNSPWFSPPVSPDSTMTSSPGHPCAPSSRISSASENCPTVWCRPHDK